MKKKVAGDAMASGWSPIASHQLKVSLQPGESKDFVFGYIENPAEDKWEAHNIINKKPALEMIARYATTEAVDKAFDELCSYWKKLLSTYQVTSKNDFATTIHGYPLPKPLSVVATEPLKFTEKHALLTQRTLAKFIAPNHMYMHR